MAGSICLLDVEYYQLAKHAFAGTFGFTNIVLWLEAGYFDLPSRAKPLLHLWSLGVEEQFYLVFPISIALLTRVRGPVLGILLSVFALSFLINTDMFGIFSPETKFFLPQFRAWELMAGAILAYQANTIELGRFTNAVAISGCLAILWSLLSLDSTNFSASGLLPAVAGTTAVIAAGKRAWINRTLLANRGAVFIGLISYPLYLWHWPLICFFNILHPEMGIASRLILVSVSILMAALTYRYIERPVRKAASRSNIVPSSLVSAMACLAVVALAIVGLNGNVGWAAHVGRFAGAVWDDKRCVAKYWGVHENGVLTLCSSSDPQTAPSVALVGDSHANRLFEGLKAYYRKKHQDVASFSAQGCLLYVDHPDDLPCGSVYRKIWTKVELARLGEDGCPRVLHSVYARGSTGVRSKCTIRSW